MFRHGNSHCSHGIQSISIIFILLLSFVWQPAQAAPEATYSITVDTLTDHTADYEKYACTSAPGDCSLRGAIRFANASAAGSVIHITIPTGTYYLMQPGSGENQNVTGDLDIISRTVFLEGAGRGLTILDGQTLDRVIDNQGATVMISQMKITQGKAPAGDYGGGGITNYSIMTLDDVLVENNLVEGSGQYSDNGGGISNLNLLTVLNSSIVGNEACSGGGINSYWGHLSVRNSTISGNTARTGSPCGYGGGIGTAGGSTDFTLSNVLVENNAADYGGGIFYNGSDPDDVILDSTIRENSATSGGGIYNYGHLALERVTLTANQAVGAGGGIDNMHEMTLVNVTVQGNTADYGSGINTSTTTTLSLDHCTVANNSADIIGSALYADTNSSVSLHNTILAGGFSVNVCFFAGSSSFTDQGYNLSTDTSCSLSPVIHDLISTDPKLGSLGYEGGPTPTMPLLPGSPALDAGDPVTSLSRDQRLAHRPVDGDATPGAVSDIGAYEYLSFPPNVFFWLPLVQKAP